MFSRTEKQILTKLPKSSGKKKKCREYWWTVLKWTNEDGKPSHVGGVGRMYTGNKTSWHWKIKLNFAIPERKKLWHSAAVFYFETAAVIVSRLSCKRTFVPPHIPATLHQPRHREDDVSSSKTFGGSCSSLSALTSCWLKQKTKPSKCWSRSKVADWFCRFHSSFLPQNSSKCIIETRLLFQTHEGCSRNITTANLRLGCPGVAAIYVDMLKTCTHKLVFKYEFDSTWIYVFTSHSSSCNSYFMGEIL